MNALIIEENGNIHIKEGDKKTAMDDFKIAYTASQVGEKFKKTKRQIYRYIKSGKLVPFAKILGEWLFSAEEIEKLAKYKMFKMRKINKSMKWLFPEYEFSKLESDFDSELIITRILERGDTKSVLWMIKSYPLGLIIDVIKNKAVRVLSDKSLNYWCWLFKIKKPEGLSWRKKNHLIRSFN